MIDVGGLRRAAFAARGMSGDPASGVRMNYETALAIADELEAARAVVEAAREALRRSGGFIRDNGLDDWDPDYRYWIDPPEHMKAVGHALAAYDYDEATR